MSSQRGDAEPKGVQALMDAPLFKWRRFDDISGERVHDFDITIERSSSETSPLSYLPKELRDQIYSYTFHDHANYKYCKDFHLGLGNLGCRCGKGLSRTNYFFYNETRVRYYQCARFVFTRPEACKKFLGIGRITKFLGNLSIAYKEEYVESSLLRPIFSDLVSSSSLQSLHLRIKDNPTFTQPPRPPVYMPTVNRTLIAMKYDLSMRPVRHPLADLKALRRLIVQGNPGVEIEEALLKLSFKVEDLAKEEKKDVQTKGKWSMAFSEWFYEIKIVD